MGLFRSVIGILFILGGIYRVLLGIGLLFFGSLFFSAIDPVSALFSPDESIGVLAVVGVGYIILGAIFIWIGSWIRRGGQQVIRI